MGKPKKNKFLYRKRSWLNKPGHHSIGLVLAETSWEEDYTWVDSYVTIGDCSRTVNLSLGFGQDEGEYKNSLHKIDTLIGILQGTRAALVECHGKVQEVLAKRKESDTPPKPPKTHTLEEVEARLGL